MKKITLNTRLALTITDMIDKSGWALFMENITAKSPECQTPKDQHWKAVFSAPFEISGHPATF